MNLAILIFSLFAINISFAAERAVIQQMKGRRAIIQFEKDIPFSVGQKIYLNSEDGTELGVQKELRNPLERKNSISFAAELSSADTTPKATTAYAISGRYGWNMERYEYGPIGVFTFTKSTASSELSRYEFGGFFDLNMIPNKPGEDFIWGGYGEATIGSVKIGTASDKNLTVFTGGAFAKWFIFSPMLAFRINGFYSNEKQGSAARNITGFEFGLTHYF